MFLAEKEINWRTLRVQKMILVRLADGNNRHLTDSDLHACNCMINLLDYLQDQAEETCLDTPASDIFTHKELEEDFEKIGYEFDGNVDNALFHLIDVNGEWLDAFVTREKAEAQKDLIRRDADDSLGEIRILTYDEWMAHSRPGVPVRPWYLKPIEEYEYYCPQCNRVWTWDEIPRNLTCELHTFVPLVKRPRTPRSERT